MKGLTDLFGERFMSFRAPDEPFGQPTFDEAKYAKAQPLFKQAAEGFREHLPDVAAVMRNMVGKLRSDYGWTNDNIAKAKDYIVRFIQDVQSGAIKLGPEEEAEPERKESIKGAAIETDGQVIYKPRSTSAARYARPKEHGRADGGCAR